MRRLLATVSLSAAVFGAQAADFGFANLNPLQSDFRNVSQDVIAAISAKPLGPATPDGITGFSVGPYATYTKTQNRDSWKRLTNDDVDAVGTVGVNARKGLPFGVDIGAQYAQVPGTDAKLYGGEVRWAILEGSLATPALGIRGSYIKLTGEKDLKADAKALDATVSKGFPFVTPYAGAGYVWGTTKSDPQYALQDVNVDKARFFVGAKLSLLLLQLTPEYERIGNHDVYNLRLSLGF
jgi:hypothetical protein